ncbi:MAG: hypothetical protein ACFB02_00760 [Mastigocoleus sp.]
MVGSFWKNIRSFIVICSILPLISLRPVLAGVRQITQEIATGHSSNKIPKIELSPGHGVNISFIQVKEIVEKVWLDNPGIASLDVDGCLSGLRQECNSQGATVIHLRRINPLKITQLPSSNASLLSVVTRGKNGRKIYVFRVAMGKSPNYHTLEITPDTNRINGQKKIRFSNINNTVKMQRISQGLRIVQKRGLISYKSSLWRRIENFFTFLRMGESINKAAFKSGISLQLVNRLMELGSG